MVFDPKTWADGELITAADLNRVEQAVGTVDEQMGSKVDTTDPRLSDARPPTTHTHPITDVDGMQDALNGKTDTTDPRLSDARTPTTHTHALGDVTGLAARLAALEYDSGWRVLTSWDGTGTRVGDWTFPNGCEPTPGSSGSVRIRRVRRRVEWLISGVSWTSAAVLFQNQIPTGFRTGDTEWIAPVAVGLTPADFGTFRRRTWGFYINGANGKTTHPIYAMHFGYETNETIPATLPGTPA